MKRLYHSIMAKYHGWQVKRLYKRMFAEMPVEHGFVYVANNGELVYMRSPTDLFVISGSGLVNNWPAFYGYKGDYELEAQ